jgi:hypothetical protein
MQAEQMGDFCKDTDENDKEPYPVVEGWSEIETGEVFLVRVTLDPEGEDTDQTDWYLPAVAGVTEEGITMTPCNTKIWTQGWARIGDIKVTEGTEVRYVPFDDVESASEAVDRDQQVIADCWEEGIGPCLEACGDVLLADSKAFLAYMKGNAKSPSFDVLKWNYLRSVMERLCKLTIAKWNSIRPCDPEKMTDDEKNLFQDEYLGPVLGEHQSSQKEAGHDVLKNMKASVNMKYITHMMDMAVSDDGPLHSAERRAKEKVLGQKEASKTEVAQLMQATKECVAAAKVLTMQLNLRTEVAKVSENQVIVIEDENGDKAKEFELRPNGDCFFNLMQVLGDKITDPNCELELGSKKAALARAEVLFEAKKAYEKDPSEFFAIHGMDFEAYYVHKTAKTTSANWGGATEAKYYTSAHQKLETRLLKLLSDGQILATSTLPDNEKERDWVGFGIYNASDDKEKNGHYNGGTIVKGDTGVTTFLFKGGEEAKAAQTMLEAMMRDTAGKKKQKKQVRFAPVESKKDFIETTVRLIMDQNNKEQPETPDNTVEIINRQSREAREAKKRQTEEEESRLAIEKSQQTAATAATDHARLGNQAIVDQRVNAQINRLELLIQQQQQQNQQAWHQQQQLQWQQQQQPVQQLQQQVQQVPQSHQAPQQPQPRQQPQQQQQPYQQQQQQHSQQQARWQSQHPRQQPQHHQQPYPHQQQQHSQQQAGWQSQQQAQPQPQPRQQGHQTGWGASQPARAGRRSPERQDPVVVVFGPGEKKDLKELLKRLSPHTATAVKGVQQVMQGAPRCLIFAKASDAALVQTLVPLLNQHGYQAAVYKDKRTGQPPKAQASSTGLAGANAALQVCTYFGATPQQPCPYGPSCKLVCYGGRPKT